MLSGYKRFRTGILLVLSWAAVTAAAPVSPAAAASTQRCGDVVTANAHLSPARFIVVKNRRATCKSARAVVRAFWEGEKVLHNEHLATSGWYWTLAGFPGWQCGTGAGGPAGSVGCRKGARQVSGEGYVDAGTASMASVVPSFEQGLGIVHVERPGMLFADRNARPGSISGRDLVVARRWSSWGGARASASGHYAYISKNGHPKSYAATITLDGGVLCGTLSDGPTVRSYTRAVVRFKGKRPPKFARTVTQSQFQPYCPDGF